MNSHFLIVYYHYRKLNEVKGCDELEFRSDYFFEGIPHTICSLNPIRPAVSTTTQKRTEANAALVNASDGLQVANENHEIQQKQQVAVLECIAKESTIIDVCKTK